MSSSEGAHRRTRSRSRERIIEAAARLFVDRGYVATTIEDIAGGAEVAVQTVYYVFGTKHSILAAVLDASIAGDHEPVPVIERPWVDRLRDETDVTAAVDDLVAELVTIIARAAPVYEVLCRAATDPDVGELFARTRRRRRTDQRNLVEALWRNGHLRADLDLNTAADIFYALVNEEIYLLLVADCGWDLERFRHWTTDVVRDQLVGRS